MIGIKPWLAVAENYSQGTLETFWLESSARKWLRGQWTYDRLILTNQWSGEEDVIRDRLKDATIIQHMSGAVEIIYKEEDLGRKYEPAKEEADDKS